MNLKPSDIRVLQALRRAGAGASGGMTTRQIEHQVGHGRPANAITALRKAGCHIETIPTTVTTRHGKAVVGRYVLRKVPAKVQRRCVPKSKMKRVA